MDKKEEKLGLLRVMGQEDLLISITEVGRNERIENFRVYRKLEKLFDKLDLRYWDEVEIYLGTDKNPSPEEFVKYHYCGYMQMGVESVRKSHGVIKIE